MGLLSTLALLAGAPPGTLPAPLLPVGKWVVEYNKSDCTVSRGFGNAQAPITFGFRPSVDATAGEVIVITPEAGSAVRRGEGLVALSPGGASFPAPWVSAPVASGAKRGTRIDVPRQFWAALPEARTITITADRATPVTLEIGSMTHALAATKACGDNLLRSWGADPAALIVPQDGMIEKLFTADNYPPDALRRGGQGKVKTLSEVDGSGALTACKVVETSGDTSLDRATCLILSRKGHFDPAPGGPSKRFLFVAVRWTIPSS